MSIESWDISAAGQHVLDAALRLPTREREILADRLQASVDGTELGTQWEQAWSDELDRRDAELDSGQVQALDLDAVRRIIHEASHGTTGP